MNNALAYISTIFISFSLFVDTSCMLPVLYPDKRYNEITQLRVHNATSNTTKKIVLIPYVNIGFQNPVANQNRTIDEQLADGIRVFKLPIHPKGNEPIAWITHTLQTREFEEYVQSIRDKFPSFIAYFLIPSFASNIIENNVLWRVDATNMALRDFLSRIKQFLDDNQHEIITLSLNIFDIYTVNYLSDFLDSFQKTGSTDYIHIQDPAAPWPTLMTMIKNNKRLVIFCDENFQANIPKMLGQSTWDFLNKQYPWINGLHCNDSYIYATNWNITSLDQLNEDDGTQVLQDLLYQSRNSGPKNKLFVMTGDVTVGWAGDPSVAFTANSYAFMRSHLDRVYKTLGVYPNFISVDFYDQNYEDLKKVVNEINDKNGNKK